MLIAADELVAAHVEDGGAGQEATTKAGAGRVTIPEAAARTGRSRKTVQSWVTKGDVTATKVGGRWLLDADSLDRRAAWPNRRGSVKLPRVCPKCGHDFRPVDHA